MESELRSLIGKYGMRAVHEGLMKEMRDTFQYLQCVFDLKNEIVTPHIHHPPVVEVVNDTIPENIQPHHEEELVIEEDSLAGDVVEMLHDPTVKTVHITDPRAKVGIKPSTPEVKSPKTKHKQLVDAKRHDLLVKGVKPESLLTEASLKKWLEDGWSYSRIAEETGVPDIQVSTISKSFGLQSNISRYVAMKKKK